MADTIILNNFAGGLNAYAPELLQPQECSQLVNWMHLEGMLQSFSGKTKFNSTAMPVASDAAGGLFAYHPSSGNPRLLASTQNYVYVSVDTAGDMRPLWNHALNNALISFTQWGSYVYMAGASGGIYRWDGFEYHAVTVTCNATTTLTGNSTAWSTGGVKQGDTIFINSTGTTWVGPYYVRAVVSDTEITTTTTLPASLTAKNYIIVRVHGCGIAAPADALTLAAEAGTTLNAGVYQYVYTYRNSNTGFESNPSPAASITLTTSRQVDIDLPASAKTVHPTASWVDMQVDQVRIYRTKVNGSIYYLQQTLTRNATTFVFGDGVDDSTADGSLTTTTTSPSGHATPNTGIQTVRTYNSRLYGWGADNVLRFSDLDAPDYWPTNDFSSVDPFSITQTAGGYVTVGRTGQVIRDIIPESGAYGASGTTGSNLLVLKSSGLAYRWFGWDWSDFQLQEGFETECISTVCAGRSANAIFWVTRDGPVMLPVGSNTPVKIYQRPFPVYGLPFIGEILADAYVVGIVWGDYYVVRFTESGEGSVYDYAYFYHIPTDTWTSLYNGTNNLGGMAIAAVRSNTMNGLYFLDYAGFIWKMFSKTSSNTYWTGTTGVATVYQSPAVALGYDLRQVKEVRFCWSTPGANQTVTAEVWTERSTSARSTTSMTAATASSRYVWTRIAPAIQGRTLQIRLTGTFTYPMTLRRIEIELVHKGKAKGT